MSNKNNEAKDMFSQFADLVNSKSHRVKDGNIIKYVVGEKGLNELIDDFCKDDNKLLRDLIVAVRKGAAMTEDDVYTFEDFFNQIDLSNNKKDKFDSAEDRKKFYLNTLSFMHNLMLMLRPDIKCYEWPDVKDRNSMSWLASGFYRKYGLTFSSFFKYPKQGYLVKILDSMPKELLNDGDIRAKIKEISDDTISDKYETKGLGVSSGSWIETEDGRKKPDGLDDVTKVFGYHDAHFSLQTYLYRNYGSCFTDEDKMNFFNKLEAEIDAMNNGERKGRYPKMNCELPVERYDDCILGKNSIRGIYEVLKDTIDKQRLAKTLAKAMFYFASPEPDGLSEYDFRWYFDTFGDDINDKIDINLNIDFDSYSQKCCGNNIGPFAGFESSSGIQVSPSMLKFISKIRITGRKNNFRGFNIEHVTNKIINSKNMFNEIDKLQHKDSLFLVLCGLSDNMKEDDFASLVTLFYPIYSKVNDANRIAQLLTKYSSIIKPSYEKYKQLLDSWNDTIAKEFLNELKCKVDEKQKIVSQEEEQKRERDVQKYGEKAVKKQEVHGRAINETRKNADQIKENNRKWLLDKLGETKIKEFDEIKVTAERSDYEKKMTLAQRQYLINNGLSEAEANAFASCNVGGYEIKDKIVEKVQGMIDQRKQWLTGMFGTKAADQFSKIKNVEDQRSWLTERIGTDCEKYYGKSSAHIKLVDGVISSYECYEESDYTSFTGEVNVSFRWHIDHLLYVTKERREWLEKMLGNDAKTFDELVEIKAQREWLTEKFNADVAKVLMEDIFQANKVDKTPLKEMEKQFALKTIGKFDRIMVWLKDNNHTWLYKILESIYSVIFGKKYELTDELAQLVRDMQNMTNDKKQNKLNQGLNKIKNDVTTEMKKENNQEQEKSEQDGISQNKIIPKIKGSQTKEEEKIQ